MTTDRTPIAPGRSSGRGSNTHVIGEASQTQAENWEDRSIFVAGTMTTSRRTTSPSLMSRAGIGPVASRRDLPDLRQSHGRTGRDGEDGSIFVAGAGDYGFETEG